MIRRNDYVSAQESRAQITREKLLKAAISLVDKHGMRYLTVRNICEEAGLSTGSFYNLFSGKDELIAYYLKYLFRSYKAQAQEESKGYNAIEKCLLMYRFYIQCCEEAGLEFVSGFYAANENPFFDFVHRTNEDELVIDIIRAYLHEGIEEGIIREDIDVEEALLHIAGLVTGMLFYWCVFRAKMDVEFETDTLLRTYLLTLAVDSNMELALKPLKRKGPAFSTMAES